MPTGVPRRRGALPHAEGERPLDAGGRKRRHKDDSNSNNDSRQPKSRRQKKNQHESAAPPPPSQKLTPEMKALQDSIVDSYALSSLKKKAATLQKILDAHQLLLTAGKHDNPTTNAELKTWIGVRWKKGDASIPTKKQPLKDMKDIMADREPM